MNFFMDPLVDGRDGHWHRDTQFLFKQEEVEKREVAKAGASGVGMQMQIALVRSDDLEVVPGTHLRWDTPEEYAIRRLDGGRNKRSNSMPGAVRVDLDVGDAVAFNPVMLHRGRYRTEKLRRTILTAYTPRSKPRHDKYSYQPWFLEEGYLDGLVESERAFYERFIEEYREEWNSE